MIVWDLFITIGHLTTTAITLFTLHLPARPFVKPINCNCRAFSIQRTLSARLFVSVQLPESLRIAHPKVRGVGAWYSQ